MIETEAERRRALETKFGGEFARDIVDPQAEAKERRDEEHARRLRRRLAAVRDT